MVDFGKSCINAAAEAQSAETLLRNSLGNVKGMTEDAKQSAVDWVNEMERSKSFDDAEISAALQRVIVKTGDLKTSQEYVSVAMEVARNKGIDLAAATTLLDTAYNGTSRGLKTFGIEVQEGATGMDYLRQIQDKVKGSGDAWAQTLEGQRATFNTTFGNFKEAIGSVLMPIATKFMEVIQPYLQKSMSWLEEHLPAIQAVIDVILKGINWVIDIAGKMSDALKPSVKIVVDTLGPYVRELFNWLKEQAPKLQAVLVAVAKVIGMAFEGVAAVIKRIVDSFKWIIDHVKSIGSAIGNFFKGETPATVPAVGGHASGGWVGLNGPELSVLGERGPEYVIPNSEIVDQSALLKDIAARLDTLITVALRIPGGIGTVVNNMGRGT